MEYKEHWENAEIRACRIFNSIRTPGSGNGRIKSDCRQVDGKSNLSDGYRVEVKSTVSEEKITLQWSWFAKIIEEAIETGQNPCLYFYLGTRDGFAVTPIYDTNKHELKISEIIQFGKSASKVVSLDLLKKCKYIISPLSVLKSPESRRIFLWKVTFDDGVIVL
jgi:Holliday junction resolvase